MKIDANIRILKTACEKCNFTWHDGLRIGVAATIEEDNITYDFSIPADESDKLIYVSGLVNTGWDASNYRSQHSDLPPVKFEYQIVKLGVPDKTKELIKVYNTVSKLSRYDKKENRKLQTSKVEVLLELQKDIRYSIDLGTGLLHDNHTFSIDHINNMETQLMNYINELKFWKNNKDEIAERAAKEQQLKDDSLKEDCVKYLVNKGLSESVLTQLNVELLQKQVYELAVTEYIQINDHDSNRKYYDDNGRYNEIPRCYYDSHNRKFNVSLEAEYY